MAIEGELRRTLLEVVQDAAARDQMQQGSILAEASRRLNLGRGLVAEQALLTLWYDLFRTGQLAWGLNLANQNPPFCHLTDRGRKTLADVSRDPANPDGYLAHLNASANLNPIAMSYIGEAVDTYNSNRYKAAAVMVGCAAESIVLEVRDDMVARLEAANRPVPKNLDDWRIKRVLDALQSEFAARKKDMPQSLADKVEFYWPAFTLQIRTVRNEVGHPVSVEPVTADTVHAALLVFPELAKLGMELLVWSATYYV